MDGGSLPRIIRNCQETTGAESRYRQPDRESTRISERSPPLFPCSQEYSLEQSVKCGNQTPRLNENRDCQHMCTYFNDTGRGASRIETGVRQTTNSPIISPPKNTCFPRFPRRSHQHHSQRRAAYTTHPPSPRYSRPACGVTSRVSFAHTDEAFGMNPLSNTTISAGRKEKTSSKISLHCCPNASTASSGERNAWRIFSCRWHSW